MEEVDQQDEDEHESDSDTSAANEQSERFDEEEVDAVLAVNAVRRYCEGRFIDPVEFVISAPTL